MKTSSSDNEGSRSQNLILILSIFFGLFVLAPTLLAPNRFQSLPDNHTLQCPQELFKTLDYSCEELNRGQSPIFFTEYKSANVIETNLILEMTPTFSQKPINKNIKLEFELSILHINNEGVQQGLSVKLKDKQIGELNQENIIRFQTPVESVHYIAIVKFLNQDALVANNVKSVEYKSLILNPAHQDFLVIYECLLFVVLGAVFLYSVCGRKNSPSHPEEEQTEKPNVLYRLLGFLFLGQGLLKMANIGHDFIVGELAPTMVLVLYVALTLLYFTSCLNRLSADMRSAIKSKAGINVCIFAFSILLGLENFYRMDEAQEKNGLIHFVSLDSNFTYIRIAVGCAFGLIYLWSLQKTIKIIRSDSIIDEGEKARFFLIQLALFCFGFLIYAQGLHMYNLYAENRVLLVSLIGFIIFGVEVVYMPEKVDPENRVFYLPTNEKSRLPADSPTFVDNDQSEIHGDNSIIEGI